MNESLISQSSNTLIEPHGGTLRELTVGTERALELRAEAVHLPSWDLTPRQVFDLELLLNGGFSPLSGFMGRDDYTSVCNEMRLSDGTLWPMPITLNMTEEMASSLSTGQRIALHHPEGMVQAIMTISDIWEPDRAQEAESVFGTQDATHPGVFSLLQETNPFYVGGTLEGLELPPQHTFTHLRYTPAQLRNLFQEHGWPQLNRVPQALGLVQFDGVAAPIPDEVIEELMRRLDEINSTTGLWNTFRAGDTVRVRSGRLDSLAQVVSEARSPQARVRVLMEFLGRQVYTEVPWQDIWPASGDAFLGAPPPAPTMSLRRTRGRGRWIKGFGPRSGEVPAQQDNEYPLS